MDWLSYFRHNRAHRLPIPWAQGLAVAPPLRGPLIRSLQRFQTGESGDGAHLKRVAAASGDPAYLAAIDLFVEEEQEHAALMARVLAGLHAPLLGQHWSDRCFRFLCNLAGLHLELMVILVAEIIAKCYFRALHTGIADPVMRAVCAQILHDEESHIAFHCDTLRPALSTLPAPVRYAAHLGWRVLLWLVYGVVLYDHRALFRALGVPPGAFRRDCAAIFQAAATRVFSPAPAWDRPAAE